METRADNARAIAAVSSEERHAAKKARLESDLAQASQVAGVQPAIGLAKPTSNLFRDRASRPRPKVDLRHFNEVVRVDRASGLVQAEGMVTYADLVDATLPFGAMPQVVPQLKSITLGGAVAGVGIEASSFRHGLVHDTVVALDVLLTDGSIVHCTPHNEHRALFYGFPNSYGTLGYALSVTARLSPVKRYVRLEHIRHGDADSFFAEVARHCAALDADFLDGTVFAPNEHYLTLGRFCDDAPYVSDYTFERIFYRSIRERTEDYLTVHDYLWRWDTDWFWCSKNVFAQQPLIRRLYGPRRLNSITYQRIMRWNSRWGVTRALQRLRGLHPESIIQDIDIPIDRAAEFLAFLHAEVGILPIWICPIRAADPATRFTLYPLAPSTLNINFGFWDVVNDAVDRPPGFRNRKIEQKTADLGGVKSLYSDSYYPEHEFWATYDRDAYRALKERYDPQRRLSDLYAKCVLRR